MNLQIVLFVASVAAALWAIVCIRVLGHRMQKTRLTHKTLAAEAEREDNARQRVEHETSKLERDERNSEILAQVRAALEAGYTMQQVLEWAYGEVYVEPVMVELEKTGRTKRNSNGWEVNVYETDKEARKRIRHERTKELYKQLTGQAGETHTALRGRDFVKGLAAQKTKEREPMLEVQKR